MRKAIGVICLFTFIALQYGKLVSYWQCRLSTDTAATLCDCEKYLLDTHKEGTPFSAASTIAKEKSEETYLSNDWVNPAFMQYGDSPCFSARVVSFLPDDHSMHVFQPPRI